MYELHKYYGELMYLVPVVLIGLVLWRGRTPFQRVAPILLDVAVLLGFLLYAFGGRSVSLWHPVLMLLAVGVAHAVARQQNRTVVAVAWAVVLILIVLGIQVAAGRINL